MGTSWDEAVRTLTAPGAPFEVVEAEVRGQRLRVFRRTPPSLRALFATARARGDAIFLVYEDERWSFADVMARVDALGAALVSRYGIAPGDRVAIAMRNYPEWVVAFAAITSIGAISVSLNAWWTSEELDYALRDSGSRRGDRRRRARGAHRAAAARVGPRGDRRAHRRRASRRRRSAGRTSSCPARRCPRWRCCRTWTPPSSTRPAPPATRRAPSRRTAPCSRRCSPSPAAPPSTPRSARARRRAMPWPTSFVLVVPLFHVTGCVPVHALLLRGRLQARDDAQVGSRARARADRARAGDQLRRRADTVLGSARVPGLRAPRHAEPGLGGRRRRAGAAGAGAARRPQLPRRAARTSATA